jgi:putative ABC transport system permease protein
MKFLPLVWSGLWRKPVRTALIFLQVTVAFALFGVLQGMKTGVDEAVAKARADVLTVLPGVRGEAPLPLADVARLKSIPGVKEVSYADILLGTYQKPTQVVAVLAIESKSTWTTLLDFFQVPPKDLDALRKTRTGALISTDDGKEYGWHIGDRIALTSTTLQTSGSGTWVFDIVGMFTDHEPGGAGGFVVANYDYLNQARAQNRDTVRNFYVVASSPKQAATVSDTIDRTFANSSSATRTSSLRDNAQQTVQSIGDVNFAIRTIVSAVLVALLFSISTMMMQSIRERTPELAVLKTLGFDDRTVFVLVAAESLLVCIAASLAGLGLAWFAFPLAAKYVNGLSMPIVVVELGILGGVLVALISVSVPGFRAARLNIVDALAGR